MLLRTDQIKEGLGFRVYGLPPYRRTIVKSSLCKGTIVHSVVYGLRFRVTMGWRVGAFQCLWPSNCKARQACAKKLLPLAENSELQLGEESTSREKGVRNPKTAEALKTLKP